MCVCVCVCVCVCERESVCVCVCVCISQSHCFLCGGFRCMFLKECFLSIVLFSCAMLGRSVS